jgi:hypothetical protein
MKEKIATAIAFRLPRLIVYWCAIRLMAHATQGQYSDQVVPELTAVDALRRWQDKSGVFWNPGNKVVQDHHDGTLHPLKTDAERKLRSLPTTWSPAMAEAEVRERPAY